MSFSPTQIEDLDELTLAHIDRKSWEDVSLPNYNYVMEDALGGRGGKTHTKGGKTLDFKLQYQNNGSFAVSGLYDTAQSERQDKMKNASAPWSKTRISYNYDIDEPVFQGDELTEVIDFLEVEQHASWNDWFAGMEELMWTAPTSPTQNPMPPWGIPLWIQTTGATSTVGFNGGDPSGFTDGLCGVLTATVEGWKNCNGTFAAVDDDDFVRKVVKSMDFCNFKAPHNYKELNKGSPDWAMYSAAYQNLEELRSLQKSQNTDIGPDLGKYSRNPQIRGVPVVHVPEMERTGSAALRTDRAVFGVNWTKMKYVFAKGRDLQWSPLIIPNKQASVRERFGWRWGNFRCTNRRSQWVLTYSA